MLQANVSKRPITGNGLAATTTSPSEQGNDCTTAKFSLAALAALALHASPAMAQEQPNTQSVQIYGGELFGDNLTETPVSGYRPRLDDNVVFGARYTYVFNQMWGLQLSGGYIPDRASRVVSGNSDLGLTTADLDVIWNITPQYPIVFYMVAGAGYAWASLDTPIEGQVYGHPAVITDSNGFSANAGVGAKYYLTGNLFFDLDARYRYLDQIVNTLDQNLNTVETTLGVGWRF